MSAAYLCALVTVAITTIGWIVSCHYWVGMTWGTLSANLRPGTICIAHSGADEAPFAFAISGEQVSERRIAPMPDVVSGNGITLVTIPLWLIAVVALIAEIIILKLLWMSSRKASINMKANSIETK